MPPRTTQLSCRPRVSNRIMVGNYLAPTLLLVKLHEPRASSHHHRMKLSKQRSLFAVVLRNRRWFRRNRNWARCKSNSSPERGVGGNFSLDIPSHRIKANDFSSKWRAEPCPIPTTNAIIRGEMPVWMVVWPGSPPPNQVPHRSYGISALWLSRHACTQ
jgi:hypothetical protein